jgi:hypothetical protein
MDDASIETSSRSPPELEKAMKIMVRVHDLCSLTSVINDSFQIHFPYLIP